jgi:hypothetical protein
MTLTSWYERLSKRERRLLLSIGGVVFVLLNYMVWTWLLGALHRARTDLAERQSARMQQTIFMKERNLWVQRDEWIKKHELALSGPGEASKLLDQIKPIAAKYNVLIENPQIGSGETTPVHQTVYNSIDTKSAWPDLVHFLYDVQQPDRFIVFESVTLSVDSNDPTVMHGRFKMARWFAPTQRKG